MWTCYRAWTLCVGGTNLLFGLCLVGLWASCFEWCLSRRSAENDLASPLWAGIICVIVGIFGLTVSCSCWKRMNETILYVLTIVAAIATSIAIVLSVHAAVKEYQLYLAQERPQESEILGVALFGVMAVFSLVAFILCVTWSCAYLFKRCSKKPGMMAGEVGDEELVATEHRASTGRRPRSASRASTALYGGDSHVPRASGALDRPPAAAAPAAVPHGRNGRPEISTVERQRGFHVPRYGNGPGRPGEPQARGQARSQAQATGERRTSAGPQFASVAAAELRWWEYYRPPRERVGFGGF